mgnify:CR=1 FL=1
MVERKKMREKGKLKFSKYFQKLSKGDYVAVIREVSLRPRFPLRIQGRTGIVEGQRGKAYVVKIKDQNKEKQFLIEPIHLRKIKTIKN